MTNEDKSPTTEETGEEKAARIAEKLITEYEYKLKAQQEEIRELRIEILGLQASADHASTLARLAVSDKLEAQADTIKKVREELIEVLDDDFHDHFIRGRIKNVLTILGDENE